MRFSAMRSVGACLLMCTSAVSAIAQEPGEGLALRRAQLSARIQDMLLGRVAMDSDALSRLRRDETAIDSFLTDPFNPEVRTPTLAELEAAAARGPTGDAFALGYDGPIKNITADLIGSLGLDASTIIVGVTDFFVARAQDEVAFAFLYHMRVPAQSRFIRTALPTSATLVSRVGTESFHSLMPMLRPAFTSDLAALPARLQRTEVLDSLGISSDRRPAVQSAAFLYSKGAELRTGRPPVAVLASMYGVTSADVGNLPVARALNTVGAIAREYAVSGEALIAELTLPQKASVRRYFVAYLARDLASVFAMTDAQVDTFFRHMSTREADVVMLLRHLHTIEEAASIAADTTPSATRDALRTLVGGSLHAIGMAQTLVPSNADARNLAGWVDEAARLSTAIIDGSYHEIVTWLIGLPGVDPEAAQLRFLSLAGALATASTPEEAASALRSVSSPVGSYRAKRSQDRGWGPGSVSVVGYLGATTGMEDDDGLPDFHDAGHAGPTLPIGIEGSIGFPGGALSLFVPLIDVGNLASTRFGGDDDIDSAPEVGFGQIFAPGIFLVYNATRSLPLSLGVGLQAVPNLRTRSGTDDDGKLSVSRLSVFVGVDATLFHFSF